MKKLLIIFFMIPIFGFSQTTEEFDFLKKVFVLGSIFEEISAGLQPKKIEHL